MKKPTCDESVWSRGAWGTYRCGKTASHDPVNGVPTKCGIHCAEAVAKRNAKTEANMRKWREQREASDRVDRARRAVEAVLRTIAAGHNDPRALALDAITELDAAIEGARR